MIDGDTIAIGGQKIRLVGIDAPELHNPYGKKAKWALVELCKGQSITAKLTGETSYDRVVAKCFLEKRCVCKHEIKVSHETSSSV